MQATITSGKRTIILMLLVLVASLAFASPAKASGNWTYSGDGTWVWTNAYGQIEEIRIDFDSDGWSDIKVFVRSNGTISWLGLDHYGGAAIDTWVYLYENGATYSFVDGNGDGKYEVQGYDWNGDGHNEWIRLDTNGDGHANDWFAASAAPQTISMPAFGTGMLNVNNACDNSTYTCSGAGLQMLIGDPYG